MAVHEIILSLGIAVGAYVGGYLSDEFGRRFAPYIFGLVVIGMGILTQLFLILYGVNNPSEQPDKNV